MANIELEHANITVTDAKKTAKELIDLFGWKIRWEGQAMNGIGYTVHVGTDNSYLAFYTPSKGVKKTGENNYETARALNHVAVTVDDLGAAEARVENAGYKAHSHADYEPGKRFYFHNGDGIEIEVVSYAA